MSEQKSKGMTGIQLIIVCAVSMLLGILASYLFLTQMRESDEMEVHAGDASVQETPVNAESVALGEAEQAQAGGSEIVESPQAEREPETSNLLDQHEPTDYELAFPDLPKRTLPKPKVVDYDGLETLTDDYEVGEYGELVHLTDPVYVRKNMLHQIRKMPMVAIEDVLKQDSAEKMNEYILSKLEKNPCQKNSEDIVISYNDKNILSFQTKLTQIKYEDLWDAMYTKHVDKQVCKGNKKLTGWSEVDITSRNVHPVTHQLVSSRGLSCGNGNFKNYDSLNDINIYLRMQFYENQLYSINSFLMWSHIFMGNYKYLDELEMDPNLIVGIDSLKTRGSGLLFDTEGTLPLGYTNDVTVDNLIDALVLGNELNVVYGRYVPDKDKFYLVLSFRSYSLREMRKKCEFLNQYHLSRPMEMPQTLRQLVSPFKSKADPKRIKEPLEKSVREQNSLMMDLPF